MPADAAPVTTSAPPLIVISYSIEEEPWKDQLVSLFPTDVELRFVFNRVDDNPGRIDQETRSALSQSSVLVLLLSPRYLTTSWISNEDGNWLGERLASGGVKIVPALIRNTSWERIPLLVNRTIWTTDGDKPIAEADNDVQALTFVVSRILDEANLIQLEPASTSREESTASAQNSWELISEVGSFKVSLEVRKTVGRAWTFVRLPGSGTEQITTELLLLALAEHGKDNPKPAKTPRFLWKELTRTKPATAKYNSLLKTRFPEVQRVKEAIWNSHSMPPATKNTLGVFELASQFSRETNKPVVSDNLSPVHDIGRIGARHLLAGLLVLVSTDRPSGALHVLSELTDVYALRNRFLDFIVKSVPQDDHEAWRRILIFEPSAEEAKVSKERQSKVAEPAAEGNVGAGEDVIQRAVHAETQFVPNVVETPSVPPPESAASGSGSVSTLSSPVETNFSELEAQLSGTYRADQPQEQLDHPPTSEDQDHAASADDEELDLRPILAGFATDYWDGRDLLDTETDVNALASLVSAWSVEPPLSIGLFGDWGSGKSHFMRQMRRRVEKLSRAARNATNQKQKDIGYYKNIVQIEFNAWHYIEGNLWASLVDHIFANLRVNEKDKADILQKRRDQLMDDLQIKKEIESKLTTKIEEQKNQLETKKQEASDLAEKAQDKKENAARELAAFSSEAESQLGELEVPFAFSETDKALLDRLGIHASELRTVADYRKQFDELKGFSNRVRAQWQLFRTDPKERKQTFFAALLAIIPLTGILLLRLPQMIAIPGRAAAVLGIVATILSAAAPTWNQIRKGREALKEKEEAIERERQKRISELQGEVNALSQTVENATREAESINKEIVALDQKIKTISTSKIMAEFIEDRAAADDYRRHLGLLALIRRDFERLRDLFERQRTEERSGQESLGYEPNKINRIVLYIDDLDRCPPQRVVEVLQAIHLLLAFPIFVVVVGVDARWVTRSLQESYEWLRPEDDDPRKENVEGDDDLSRVQGATPHDYLEKIFQIPFWLRPMEGTQTKIFIDGLTEQVRYRPPQEEQQRDEQSANGNKLSDQLMQTDLGSEVTNQESAASGNGHPPQTVTDPVVQDLPIAVGEDGVINPQENQIATADSSMRVDEGAVVDEKVAPETTETPVANIASEQQITDKSKDVAMLEREADAEEDEDEDEEEIDLAPHSLTLGDEEIEYMKSLAEFIGRSPRAVKRFLNCYRLIKVSLSPKQLEKFVQNGTSYEYKAVMILLGIITGAPTASLFVAEEIENWQWDKKSRPTMDDFHNQLESNEDLRRQPDWARLKTFLSGFRATEESADLFAAFKRNTPKVSRYSFRIARAEAAGPKRATAPQSKPSATSLSPKNKL